jgi:hypothetical protein
MADIHVALRIKNKYIISFVFGYNNDITTQV